MVTELNVVDMNFREHVVRLADGRIDAGDGGVFKPALDARH